MPKTTICDFTLIRRFHKERVYEEDLKSIASKSVLVFRTSMIADLERAECLEGASAVWSMWAGYLDKANPSGKRFTDFCGRNAIPCKVMHSSGHASVQLLKDIVAAIKPVEGEYVHTLADSKACISK